MKLSMTDKSPSQLYTDLDPSLLRPGRFDRRVPVELPMILSRPQSWPEP